MSKGGTVGEQVDLSKWAKSGCGTGPDHYAEIKYQIAEKKFDLYRMMVEKAAARGVAPKLRYLIKYYDAVKDYMTAKIELEIYYYGAKESTAKQDVPDED